MLGDHPIEVVLLATDLKVSRDFYADKIGLKSFAKPTRPSGSNAGARAASHYP